MNRSEDLRLDVCQGLAEKFSSDAVDKWSLTLEQGDLDNLSACIAKMRGVLNKGGFMDTIEDDKRDELCKDLRHIIDKSNLPSGVIDDLKLQLENAGVVIDASKAVQKLYAEAEKESDPQLSQQLLKGVASMAPDSVFLIDKIVNRHMQSGQVEEASRVLKEFLDRQLPSFADKNFHETINTGRDLELARLLTLLALMYANTWKSQENRENPRNDLKNEAMEIFRWVEVWDLSGCQPKIMFNQIWGWLTLGMPQEAEELYVKFNNLLDELPLEIGVNQSDFFDFFNRELEKVHTALTLLKAAEIYKDAMGKGWPDPDIKGACDDLKAIVMK